MLINEWLTSPYIGYLDHIEILKVIVTIIIRGNPLIFNGIYIVFATYILDKVIIFYVTGSVTTNY